MPSKRVDLPYNAVEELYRIIRSTTTLPAIFFGSRVMGSTKKYSDIDICIRGESFVSSALIGELQEKADQSSIPFVVDFSDYQKLPENFKKEIDKIGVDLDSIISRKL